MKKFIVLAMLVIGALGYTQGFKDGENLIIGTKGDLGIRRLGVAAPGITDGGTTQGNILATYTCGTTTTCTQVIATTKLLQVYGTVALSTGAATLTALPFTGTATFACTGADQTAANAIKIVPASASTATFAGTTSDVISYECHGT
jgi:hypothetical protein